MVENKSIFSLLRWLKHPFQKRLRARRVLMAILLFIVMIFSAWLFKSFWSISRLRDDLIAQKSDGLLSDNIGFLAFLNSEVKGKFNFDSIIERQRTETTKNILLHAQGRLEELRLPLRHSPTTGSGHAVWTSLEDIHDENTLLQLLASPGLAALGQRSLGLDAVINSRLPSYPYLETAASLRGASSYVFIPAPLVDLNGNLLSLKLRRELVFSKIVERDLKAALADTEDFKFYQSYYVSCGDFIRLVHVQSKNQLLEYAGKFSPMRSLADRSYFRETRDAPYRFRQSEPYIDVTGGGLVKTYSVFVDNKALVFAA